jgi:hypothetical protein
MATYTNPQDVKDYTGAQPEFLSMSDEQFDATLERWIKQAEELVNAYCRRSWTGGSVPEGGKDATERIVSNKVAQARLHRRAGVIRTDQYGQREESPMPSTRLLTQAIKDDLNLYRQEDAPAGGDTSTEVGTIALGGALARDGSELPDTFGDWEPMAGQYPYVSEEQRP